MSKIEWFVFPQKYESCFPCFVGWYSWLFGFVENMTVLADNVSFAKPLWRTCTGQQRLHFVLRQIQAFMSYSVQNDRFNSKHLFLTSVNIMDGLILKGFNDFPCFEIFWSSVVLFIIVFQIENTFHILLIFLILL